MRDKIGRSSLIDHFTSQVGAGSRWQDLGGASMMVSFTSSVVGREKDDSSHVQ